MGAQKYKIILFYKYIPISNPQSLNESQLNLCGKLGLKGRVIIAEEGINATLEGTAENIDKYLDGFLSDSRFSDTHIKTSGGSGNAFPKLSIKVRSEIVAYRLGEDDVKPWVKSGKYLMPQQLHDWICSGKKFYIVDFRNDFEQEVGYFKNSILTNMGHSQDLPKVIPKLKNLESGVPIVTVCTGGIRCEKASGFLIKNGFEQVYKLYGGIVSYMEKYPNEDFLGALYTFDSRLVMGFNMDDPKRVIVGKCANCQKPSENFINCTDNFCHRHFIACEDCLGGNSSIYCPMGCRDYSKEHPESVKNAII